MDASVKSLYIIAQFRYMACEIANDRARHPMRSTYIHAIIFAIASQILVKYHWMIYELSTPEIVKPQQSNKRYPCTLLSECT